MADDEDATVLERIERAVRSHSACALLHCVRWGRVKHEPSFLAGMCQSARCRILSWRLFAADRAQVAHANRRAEINRKEFENWMHTSIWCELPA